VSSSAANGAYALVVLVVEDELLIRCNVVERLREAGYNVVETDSGEEAISLCQSDMSIDAVFTDINLSGSASGLDVAEHFHIDRPTVPVIYTSGLPVEPQRLVPRSVFVPKPYECSDVLSALQRARVAPTLLGSLA
jgi:CheY-like chemotaxis protein